MNSVKMLYKKEGSEYLLSKGTLSALSIRDKKHPGTEKGGGTAHALQDNPLFVWPKKPELWDNIDKFRDSPAPEIHHSERDGQMAWYGGEFEFWGISLDPAKEIGPAARHEYAIQFYGQAMMHNGAIPATKHDGQGNIQPLQIAAGVAVVLAVFVVSIGALWFVFGRPV